MKLIYLDIDGVLNGHEKLSNSYCGIRKDCVQRLNKILEKTNAKIIISSAWRYMILGGSMTIRGFDYMLTTHGLIPGSVIGHTSSDETFSSRESQILYSKSNYLYAESWVILDDLLLQFPFDYIQERFVRTNGSKGLQAKDVQRVLKILGTQKK